jgi:hypothetical protein
MSFALLRAASIAAVAFVVALPVGASAQGGLPSDKPAAQRTAQRGYDRALERSAADIAAMNAAIKECDYHAYGRAHDAYDRDRNQADLYEKAGAVRRIVPGAPQYPENCTPPVHGGGGGGPRFGPHYVLAGAQPFVGFNIGGGFENTNFSVAPPFNINGSGVVGGGFGGILLPVPNTNAQIGPRFGIQGSNITGSMTSPAASPPFTYAVRTDWMAYQEAIVRIPVWGVFKIAENESPVPQDRAHFSYNYYDNVPHVTGSVGVAESGTSVKGVSGAFSVTDNAVRTGITFTAGFDVPVATLPNGVIDLFAQYRGIQWISTVNIPGGVNIGSFTNEVDVGVTLHLGGGLTYTLKN